MTSAGARMDSKSFFPARDRRHRAVTAPQPSRSIVSTRCARPAQRWTSSSWPVPGHVLPPQRLAARGARCSGTTPTSCSPSRRAHRWRVAAGAGQELAVRAFAGRACPSPCTAARWRRRGSGRPGGARQAARETLGADTWNCGTIRRHDDWPIQDLYVTFRKEILPRKRPTCWPSPQAAGDGAQGHQERA